MNIRPTQLKRVPMEFWFDFASNYSYLSVMRIEAAAQHLGVEIIWRPFLLGPVFQSLGWNTSPFVLQKAKGEYVWKDMVRQCAKYSLPWSQPTEFPRASVLPLRVALTGAHSFWMGDFCRAVMKRNFVSNEDINSHESVLAILHQLNLSADQMLAAALTDANKPKLREQTQLALEKGVFGAPTFIVGHEMFWGNDRLDDALAYCSALNHAGSAVSAAG